MYLTFADFGRFDRFYESWTKYCISKLAFSIRSKFFDVSEKFSGSESGNGVRQGVFFGFLTRNERSSPTEVLEWLLKDYLVVRYSSDQNTIISKQDNLLKKTNHKNLFILFLFNWSIDSRISDLWLFQVRNIILRNSLTWWRHHDVIILPTYNLIPVRQGFRQRKVLRHEWSNPPIVTYQDFKCLLSDWFLIFSQSDDEIRKRAWVLILNRALILNNWVEPVGRLSKTIIICMI